MRALDRWRRPLLVFALGGAGLTCAPIVTSGPGCSSEAGPVVLPRRLAETSGVAVSRTQPGVLWTHNDDGSLLVAIDARGHVLGQWNVRPELGDWEDIELAACGPDRSCLYLADTGDNEERRANGSARILRVTEPAVHAAGGERTLDAEVFPLRLPEGPRDIEALFVLPGERAYLVTKGRRAPVTVYRYPAPLRSDTVTLEEVQRLGDGPEPLLSQVTGASASAQSSADGTLVAIRTYQSLQFYRAAPRADTLVAVPDGFVSLRTLEEIQGEGVGLGPDGLVVLTSEGGPFGGPPSLRLLRCRGAAAPVRPRP